MTDDLILHGQEPRKSLHARILETYKNAGGEMSIRQLVNLCMVNDILYPDEERSLVERWLTAEAPKALKAFDRDGLPYAGLTEKEGADGNPMYRVRDFWDEEDAVFNIRLKEKNIGSVMYRYEMLWEYCDKRFPGKMPPLLSLEEPQAGRMPFGTASSDDDDDEEDFDSPARDF